jgi:hypothetical protein
MPKKKVVLQRNFPGHRKFLKENPPKGDVDCKLCADVWCWRNTTPTRLLPRKENRLGKIRQLTCDQMIRDPLLPVDLGK